MKLIDILEVYNENDKLTVVDKNDDFLALYDEKNSIPNELNNHNVINIYPLSIDNLVVMID